MYALALRRVLARSAYARSIAMAENKTVLWIYSGWTCIMTPKL
jgi:hypothetical protein